MNNSFRTAFIINLLVIILSGNTQAFSQVKIIEVNENIPTYLTGPPDPNPMFFFGQGSQGAEGRIYPYALYDNLTNKKSDKTYKVVYIENEYLKIGILPEIGGRLFSAVDKTNNYSFIYTQHVIKPALIGLTGAWISGGIEWNIPHHHRASTFIPVQWTKEEQSDGSMTVWVGELEIRHRMRWAVGYTLRPGSSVLECSVRIINRTPEAHSMLCFANVAVAPNDNYQVIFPPGTQWSTGHSKRGFSPWPVSDSVDQSWYKNHPNSGSFFAWNYEDDFVAGFDHGKNAGIMTVADHNIVPGKKFFTWGIGSMWDKILTDDDGPYLEIMVGAYSDNQPDYSWMQPFEERSFEISWYPFRGIDGVKKANLDAAVNLDVNNGNALFGFCATRAIPDAIVRLTAGKQIIVEEHIGISPSKPYSKKTVLPPNVDEHDVRASLSLNGKELIAYSPVRLLPVPRPESVNNPLAPQKIKNSEELFLAGQRIDQFHNPSLDAGPYWEELLKRDPGNTEANTGMGLLDLRCARYDSAEQHFRKAIKRLTFQYTTPKNAEPFYYLGVVLKAQGRFDEAFTSFYKAAWSQEWKAPSYYSLAEIAASENDFERALKFINQSLDANANNIRAYSLKAAMLRHLGRQEEALGLISFATSKTDPLDVRLMAEKWLITKDDKIAATLYNAMNSFQITAEETAAEYLNSGLWDDGVQVLTGMIISSKDKTSINPLVYYYLGHFHEKLGNTSKASECRKQAALQSPDYVFPFQSELIVVLQRAIEMNPGDARAHYYMGNLLFDWQPDEAISHWGKAISLEPQMTIALRNLSQAYSHKTGDENRARAITFMEKAVAVSNPCPTHFAELDRLYKSSGTPVSQRLAILEKNQQIVIKNDEALGSIINLKTFSGKADEAIVLMKNHIFSIWEGGNAFNTGQAWTDAHLVRGLKYFSIKKYTEALADFSIALTPPENLRAQQGRNYRQLQIAYWRGCAYEKLGEKDKAKQTWEEMVSSGSGSGRPGLGDQKYFIALAHKKLGSTGTAEELFGELSGINTGIPLRPPDNSGDPQFVAARRLPSRDNLAMPHYTTGLGYAGLGNKNKAREEFNAALSASPDFLSAKIALDLL